MKVVLMMGVCGCGKSIVGEALAKALRYDFLDADALHTSENREKMRAGIPLTDADRMPWLRQVRDAARERVRLGRSVVIACSALKEIYREVLRDIPESTFSTVLLTGEYATLQSRLANRVGHFMNPALLDSQLATLEPPQGAIIAPIERTVEEIVRDLVSTLTEPSTSS